MNLNKEFLSEIISYLISKGVTIHEVMDAYNARFEHEKPEVKATLPQGDIDLLLCGRNVEENPLPCRKLKSKSGQMLFDVINGKTVIEHLKENGITYTNFDNRIRKNWSVEKACTTPLTKVVKPYTRVKKSEEPKAVIVPDNVKVEEETPIEKPEETLETQSNTENTVLAAILAANQDANIICLESEKITGTKTVIPAENTAENVTVEPQTETDTDTRVNDTNANSDAKNSESERIEQLTDKTVRDIVTGKNKEKKKAEPKRDYTASDLCLKLGLTTHELREKIEMGEIPQPDCGNKWSAKLLKDKDIILFF